MSLIVNIGTPSDDQDGGGFYPQVGYSYRAVIQNITKEQTATQKKDILNIPILVEGSNGDTYEDKMNGPSILYNDYFGANVSRLIKAVLGSKENEGNIDPAIGQTPTPDISLLVGKYIGVQYDEQYNNKKFASVDRVITTDKVNGCYDEAKNAAWKKYREDNKDVKKGSGGSAGTPVKSTSPFARQPK